MTHMIIKFRWWIVAACLVTGLAFALLIPSAETDPEIRNYVPENLPSRVETDSIEAEFGTQDMVMVLFTDSSILQQSDLRQIRDVDKGISRISGISQRISPFTIKTIRGDNGSLTAERLIKSIPSDEPEIALLKQRITENSLAGGTVISQDFTAAAITATIDGKNGEIKTLNEIDSVISVVGGPASAETGGLPYIRKYIMKDVKKDGVIIVPVALLIMLLILKFTLGSWKSVFMPFTVVILSTAISMGLYPLLGWKFSVLSLLVPIILISVANNYGIYLVARHQELSRLWSGSDHDIIGRLMGSLNMPILFSGLTTIAGVLGLAAHSIIPAKQGGILAATGVTIALLMSLLLIPAMLYIRGFQKSKSGQSGPSGQWLQKAISVSSRFIVRRPGTILASALAITILLSLGIILLRIDTNQENMFSKNHPIRTASDIINTRFGGSQTISVMISGDIKNPELMKRIDSLTESLLNQDGVGNVFSISRVVREMTKAVYLKGEHGYDNIPESREGIAQLFELYNMSGDQGDFEQLMNLDNSRAHILVTLSKPENLIIEKLRVMIGRETAGMGAEVVIGGYAIIMADLAQSIIKGQVLSLLFAVITVFLLLAMIFRSFNGGFVGTIPLAGSILVLFGFMGFAGIALDAATALISSIMIGVGVDFTIQYMWCFNAELRSGLNYEEAIQKALHTIGRSILINAFSVMAGFSALLFSGFASIRFFGYLVLISIGACLIGALLVIPAYLLKFRPRFIEKDLSGTKKRKYENETNLIHVTSAAFTAGTSSAT